MLDCEIVADEEEVCVYFLSIKIVLISKRFGGRGGTVEKVDVKISLDSSLEIRTRTTHFPLTLY